MISITRIPACEAAPPLIDGETYRLSRLVVKERFDALPRGARAHAAAELRLNPALVSDLLNGRRRSLRLLGRLGEWAQAAANARADAAAGG